MLVKPTIMGEQGMAVERPLMPGDFMASGDASGPFVVDETAGGVTLTQAQFAQSCSPALEVSGNAGAVATTLPSADQIIAAIKGNANVIVPPTNSPYAPDVAPPMQWPSNLGVFEPQMTFRWVIRNLNAGTTTLTAPANVGVSISGTATIATVKWREYIVRILCSAPTVVVGCSTTNANKVLNTTDLETLKKVQIGQSVFGVGIGASAVVRAIDYNTGNITVDVNSTATAGLVAVTFTPTVTFTNLRAGDT
jgi:hypothetical protein